jgi:predicted dienelactone hydrolase
VVAVNGSVPAPAVGTTVDASCFVPDSGGPFPLVTIAPGFQLPASQYVGSAAHLASFGFVACVAAYNASLFSPNHLNNAKEVLAVVDWALAPTGPLAGKADPLRVGAAGHSLGGRLSVLAASLDDRIGAVFAMDPVDADDPDASSLSLPIPTGFLGELTDSQGGFQPCAPADRNFETFYTSATSPSFKVEVLGANHMSFLDDPGSCGLVCSFCKPASLDHDQVISLTRSYLAAFFLRHLGNEAGYDTYLTGAIAEQRYEQTGVAIIDAK